LSDVVLAHLARAVGDQGVAVFEGDAKARVGEDLIDSAVDFNQFFFGHGLAFGSVRLGRRGFVEPKQALFARIAAGRLTGIEAGDEAIDAVVRSAATAAAERMRFLDV
jgi:hypothetical protein